MVPCTVAIAHGYVNTDDPAETPMVQRRAGSMNITEGCFGGTGSSGSGGRTCCGAGTG